MWVVHSNSWLWGMRGTPWTLSWLYRSDIYPLKCEGSLEKCWISCIFRHFNACFRIVAQPVMCCYYPVIWKQIFLSRWIVKEHHILSISRQCVLSASALATFFLSSFVFIILSSPHNVRPFWIINGQRRRRQRYILPHQTNFTMGAKGHFAWWQPDNGMWQGKLACHTLVGCFMFCECLWFWKQVLYVYHFGERAGDWERKKGIVLRKRKTGDWNGKLPFALISVLGHCGGTQKAAWDGSRPCFICLVGFFLCARLNVLSLASGTIYIHFFSFVMRIFHKNTYRWTEWTVILSRGYWEIPPFSFVVQLLAGKVM